MGGLSRPAPPIIITGMPLGRWQVSKPKVSKPNAQEAGTDGAEDSPLRPQIVHLNSIPIADPWHEKKMFEAGEFTRKLNTEYASAIVAQNEDNLWRRIIGSAQESGEVCILRGFLESDEFGARGGQPLCFQ
jgi:hypothetical protein